MRKGTLTLILTALLLGSMPIVQTGCESKRGCTDKNADNYNAEAEEDDDTCVPMRAKFLGEYYCDGQMDKEGGAVDINQPNGAMELVIEDVTLYVDSATKEDPELVFGFSNVEGTQFPLTGVVVSKFDVDFPNQTLGDIVYFGNGHVSGRVIDLHITRVFLSPDINVTPNDTDKIHILGLRNPCCDCSNVHLYDYSDRVCNGDPRQGGQSWASFRGSLVAAGCDCEY